MPKRAPITMPAIAPPERWCGEGGGAELGRLIGIMWACCRGFGQVHWEMEKFFRS